MEHLGKIMMKSIPEGDRMKALNDYIEIIRTETAKKASDSGDSLIKEWERLREKKGIGG
jgi:hemerythrin superfamily protein